MRTTVDITMPAPSTVTLIAAPSPALYSMLNCSARAMSLMSETGQILTAERRPGIGHHANGFARLRRGGGQH